MKPSRTGEFERSKAGLCYEFGTFRLDPGRRRLETADGHLLRTSAKAFDALQHFLENPGRPIARRTLMEALWPGRVVEENNLSQAISGLRRALGDGYIVTVPGQGYQFVADVRRLSREDLAAAAGDAVPLEGKSSPLEGRPSRPAWRAPAAFAFALAVAVGGSIYFTSRGLTGNGAVTLVQGAEQAQASSATASRVDELDAYGVPGGTDNERANELYRSGKLLSRRDEREALLQAADEFARARALDEDFALAWIAEARVLYNVAVGLTVAADIAQSWERFTRARDEVLERWPDVPAARGLAAQRYVSEDQWRQAESALAEWVELTAEQDFEALWSYGAFLDNIGRLQDALPYLEAAHESKPDLAAPLTALSMTYHSLGWQDRAQEADDESMTLPGYRTMFASTKFWGRLAAGDHLGAQQYFIDVQVAVGGWDRGMIEEALRTREPIPGLNAFAMMFGTSVAYIDDSRLGLEHLRDAFENPELQSGAGMLNIALFAAHFGDINLSIAALRRSLAYDRAALKFSWMPIMQAVRRHEEFKALMREIDIVDYWRERGWPEHCRPLRDDDFACT